MPRPASTRSRWVDLAIGIPLGLVLGLVLAYLLIIVIGGSRDASHIDTTSTAPPRGATTTAPSGGASPAPPGQRR
jgi:hypothetical protein